MNPWIAEEKAALLLLSLGTDEAAEVLKHLRPRDVQRVGQAMARMQPQERSKVEPLLDELEAHCAKGSPIQADEAQIRHMLTLALGEERAAQMIPQVLPDPDSVGLDRLRWMDAASAAAHIQNEHPQIVAAILAHLESDQAGDILKRFSASLRDDVILRIATLGRVQPMALKELDAALARMLTSDPPRRTGTGCVRHTAEILRFVGGTAEQTAIDRVRQVEPALAEQLEQEIHGFEGLLDLDESRFQTLVQALPRDTLIVALKGAAPALRDRAFATLPAAAATALREDFDARGPASLAAVEAAQRETLNLARRLDEREPPWPQRGAGDDEGSPGLPASPPRGSP